jgi:hypothetical protein
MTDPRALALDMWCILALDISNLDDLEVWQAFLYREEVRQAIAAGWDPDDDEQASLDAADRCFAAAAPEVLPFLHHRAWVDRLPAEHYARAYVARHEPAEG